MMRRVMMAVVVGGALLGSSLAGAGAQELPTGAARVVEKVQTRVFIGTAMLKQHVAAIVANQPTPGG